MGIRTDQRAVPLTERLAYAPHGRLFFVDLERLTIKTQADIDALQAAVSTLLTPMNHRVHAIVNRDHLSIPPDLEAAYHAMTADLYEQFYADITRYTTSAFLRLKLGQTLAVAPNDALG